MGYSLHGHVFVMETRTQHRLGQIIYLYSTGFILIMITETDEEFESITKTCPCNILRFLKF